MSGKRQPRAESATRKRKPAAKAKLKPARVNSKPDPSSYILELSVDPGGARRGEVFTYQQLDHICRVLEQEFASTHPERVAFAADLAIAYREPERILLHVVKAGAVAESIDLRPLIRVRWTGGPSEGASLADEEALAPLLSEYERVGRFDSLGVKFEIDHKRMAACVPALDGSLLEPRQVLRLPRARGALRKLGSYLAIADQVPYGYCDLEGGEEQPADWEDPHRRTTGIVSRQTSE